MGIEKLIKQKKARIAIIGLGYVGLPLALLLSSRKFETIGIDRDKNKIKLLNSLKLPMAEKEPGLKDLLFKSKKHFKAILPTAKVDADIFIVIVNTPVDKLNKPNNEPVLSASKFVAENIKRNSLVIIESTVAPMTTRDIIIPALEKYSKLKVNSEFYVAVCPERIRPNHVIKQLTTFSRVIGGSSPTAAQVAKLLYSKITSGNLDLTDTVTAETVKTVENASRDVQIAFANEMALLCERLGVNVWDLREFVNKDPFKNMLKPGAGVGGHCLPEDPWLLNASTGNISEFIPTSRKINDNMPRHVFSLIIKSLNIKKINPKNAKLLILGLAYTEDCDDYRNSPTEKLVRILKKKKINYKIHDPLIKNYNFKNLYKLAKEIDCIILMVSHSYYNNINLTNLSHFMRTKIIIDGRNFFDKKKAQNLGYLYKGVGNV